MNLPSIVLDQLDAATIQREVVFNGVTNAMSPSALFGVRERGTRSLSLSLLGGVLQTAGGPVAVADDVIQLAANDTTYIYVTNEGTITDTLTAPSGWPGPLANAARALYEITTDADSITGGICYRLGKSTVGPAGPIGAQGPAGPAPQRSRFGYWTVNGSGSSLSTTWGMGIGFLHPPAGARTMASTSFSDACNYMVFTGGGSTAGSSAEFYNDANRVFRGNAAGRGGFRLYLRWRYETSFDPANRRNFCGLRDVSGGNVGNVEPSSLVNLIGVGSDAGEANFSVIHNDGSGTATKVALGASFPARSTDNVYELELRAEPNGSSVDYVFTNCNSGAIATGTISTDLPASTQFLGLTTWSNNGSSATSVTIGMMQAALETRY